MSDPLKIALVGATGLIGKAIVRQSTGREDMRLFGVARREMALPTGARMELFIADPHNWGDVFADIRPDVLISALGTTWKKSGRDEAAFRAVDQELVLDTARAAQQYGVKRLVSVSSIGADPQAKSFYPKVKGEVERDLLKIGFDRLDILRPGLLRGTRGGDRRLAERVGIAVSPISNLFMQGSLRKFRSIRDDDVARAALTLSSRKAAGKFVHEHDALIRAANSLPDLQD